MLSTGGIIQFRKVLLLISLILIIYFSFAFHVYAGNVVWTGGGADNLASNADNWTNSVLPQERDDVTYNIGSSIDSIWNINLILGSLTVDSGYSGLITLSSDLEIAGNVIISDGTLNLSSSNLTIGVPPSATNETGSSTNGDSGTLSAIVNPNGLVTTVYFECRSGATYDFSTTPQSIGNGNIDMPFSDMITGLSPNTTYYCRVAVSNAAGTSYGDDVSFITPPIALTIISPSDGSTINRPDVMVRGSVTNVTGNDTGVAINGIVSVVYNGEFFVNHVPLQDGLNNLEITAMDSSGNSAAISSSLTASINSPHVILSGNNESGISSLTVYFTILKEITNTVIDYKIDFEGDGTDDLTLSSFNDVSYVYNAEGVYFPKISITDEQSNVYNDTISIVIISTVEIDNLLQSKWINMTSNLSAGDISSALTYIHSQTNSLYSQIFNAIPGQLPSIMATQSTLTLISLIEDEAEYDLQTLENSMPYSYEVIFSKDADGLWKIKEF